MNVDLPPSSGFVPDPTVARHRLLRDPLTLTLPLGHGPVNALPELMSGSISINAASSPRSDSLRTAIPPADDVVLTITF